MQADCDYKIGHEHSVCQDYALADVSRNYAYAIVCDGCSSSKNVDIGARALALAARETMKILAGNALDYEEFGKITIRKAETLSAIFPSIELTAFDSTLMVAMVQDSLMTTFIYGDGTFFHKTPSGVRRINVEFDRIEDRGPAPYYLSYQLDPDRLESYLSHKLSKQINDDLLTAESLSGSTKYARAENPVIIQTPVAPGDIIVLCSDGINSFRHADGTNIAPGSLLEDFTGFKTTTGVFVKRRLGAFLRQCQKVGTTHFDDVSVAAIAV